MSRVLPVLLFLIVPSAALAQEQVEAASAFGGRVVTAVRLADDDELRLDGIPDEPFWRRAGPATDFLQRDPSNGAPATERTEVRIVYDDSRVVLGVSLYDSEPDRLLGNQMQRDQSFSADDRFMWTIDTFLDARNAYYFEINPSGAMGDGLVNPAVQDTNFGFNISKSWDGIWTARVRRTMEGWFAEIEIPLRTLNFDPASEAWGVNFQRTIRRKNEEDLWTGYTRNQGLARMSSAGHVVGFAGLSQGLGLDVVPYVVGNVSSAPGRGRPGSLSTGDVGLDAFYNLTPALRANVSINTDFAETEVDQRRVNLTRFPLFFEEKRSFFLEGSSFFDFSAEQGNFIKPFFSRRIGLDERGNPHPIEFGAKVTGQAGPFDIGVLQVRTAHDASQPGDDFSVVRVRRRTMQQGYVGAMYTRRASRVAGEPDRHTGGVDFELRSSSFRGNQNLAVSGMYLRTSNPAGTGYSGAYAARITYPNDPLSMRFFVRALEENYDPAVGYYQRRGAIRISPVVEYRPRPRSHRFIRNFEFTSNWNWSQDDTHNHRPLAREFQITALGIDFHSGDRFEFELTPTYDLLEEDFEISRGVVLPTGSDYWFTRYRFVVSTSARRVFSIQPQVEVGDFYSGRRSQYSATLNVRPRRGILLSVDGEHNVLNLAEGSFDTDVFRARANTQFSPWLSLVNNLQYDTVTRQLGWQLRFRWIQKPGNDLYLVYTHNWREGLDGPLRRFETLDSRLATKLIYTLGF